MSENGPEIPRYSLLSMSQKKRPLKKTAPGIVHYNAQNPFPGNPDSYCSTVANVARFDATSDYKTETSSENYGKSKKQKRK